jgi:hypothetical protein
MSLVELRAEQILVVIRISQTKIKPTPNEWTIIRPLIDEIDGPLMKKAAFIHEDNPDHEDVCPAERNLNNNEQVRCINRKIIASDIIADLKVALLVYLKDPGRCQKVPNIREIMIDTT